MSLAFAKKLGSGVRKTTILLIRQSQKRMGLRKSQFCQSPHLRNVRKSDKLFKPANLRFCDSRSLFADRPPLGTEQVAFSLPIWVGWLVQNHLFSVQRGILLLSYT